MEKELEEETEEVWMEKYMEEEELDYESIGEERWTWRWRR